jgi:hypothetical protein
MNPDAAYKMLDGVISQIQMTRQDHVNVQSGLRFLYERAKEAEENKVEKKKNKDKKDG